MIYKKYIKRIVDIFGSILGIILFSPIMLLASIWIKIVSPDGPILADIPNRVGKGRKPFRFYKFRSMYPNAHELLKKDPKLYEKYVKNNYKLSSDEDPRLIKGGKFLRKSSIDEIPQFFNVLKGEMSIVGPRAYYFDEVEEQLKRFPEAQKYIDEVMTIKPGITGLWQVSGRSDIGFVDRVKLDAEYAKNMSLLYDLQIVVKTPYVVLTGKGAI
ncbi:MAG TPA: sugar transferase [bacterium]|jgi:lipopolysaccharide/colanic/teichoic acid biosynthesis glycosyltransferase|nr:sugar transferase [bacterium]